MPNWCSNYLHVEGEPNQLQEFKNNVTKVNDRGVIQFTMEKLLPTPEGMLEDTGIMPAWYNWRLVNWGTKWDVDTINIDENGGESFGTAYSTAWSPNDAFIKYASTQYPTLKFRLTFEEPGMGFCGVLICEDGEVIDEETGDLQWMDEYDNIVEWDSKIERWRIASDNTIIDDEDFYPQEYNPFN